MATVVSCWRRVVNRHSTWQGFRLHRQWTRHLTQSTGPSSRESLHVRLQLCHKAPHTRTQCIARWLQRAWRYGSAEISWSSVCDRVCCNQQKKKKEKKITSFSQVENDRRIFTPNEQMMRNTVSFPANPYTSETADIPTPDSHYYLTTNVVKYTRVSYLLYGWQLRAWKKNSPLPGRQWDDDCYEPQILQTARFSPNVFTFAVSLCNGCVDCFFLPGKIPFAAVGWAASEKKRLDSSVDKEQKFCRRERVATTITACCRSETEVCSFRPDGPALRCRAVQVSGRYVGNSPVHHVSGHSSSCSPTQR